MSLYTAPDVPLTITVPGISPTSAPFLLAERRISPSWTIGQLKAKLEPVTGIPPSAQRLRTRAFDDVWVAMDDDERFVGDREWGAGIRRGGEIEVSRERLSVKPVRLVSGKCVCESKSRISLLCMSSVVQF